jgi:hypothetical protein
MEGHPSDEQKNRLEDWLTELMLISRKYRIVATCESGDIRLIDVNTDTVIELGILPLLDTDGRVTAMDCTGSILDGVWLVDTPTGAAEQRSVGPVWPHRSAHG